MYFSLERQHYVTFHLLRIFGHHWSLLFTVYFHIYLLIYFLVYLESGGRFKILKFRLKFGYEVGFEFNLEGFLKCFFFKCLGSPCSLTLCNQTVLTSLPGHSSILKCHGFTKKGFYFVFAVCMHISKSFLYFVSLSNLHTQNTLKLHDDFNLLHDPTSSLAHFKR